jgi:transposase
MSRPFVLEKRKPRSQIRLEIERIRAEKELAKYREERLTKFDLAAIKERLRR